jgi:hypothetical protein
MYVDEDGEFIHLIIGALIGGIVNLIANADNIHNFWQGLGYFGVGAAAGALSAGVGAGVNVAMAGGSFGAGFMGTAVGVSSTGFIAGATTSAAAGFAGGFVTNSGNAWMGGANFRDGLWSGVKGGGIGALTGGAIGGITGGIDALIKGTNFWTGEASFDLSNAFGASGTAIGDKTITGKYVGKFEGTNLYESSMMPDGAAATLPGRGIVLSKGQYTLNSASRYTRELLQHEFGHILQAKEVGLKAFYTLIAPESLASAAVDGVSGWSHSAFWTETWANYLSNNYFGVNSLLNNSAWPAQNISWFNLLRLRAISPFFFP